MADVGRLPTDHPQFEQQQWSEGGHEAEHHRMDHDRQHGQHRHDDQHVADVASMLDVVSLDVGPVFEPVGVALTVQPGLEHAASEHTTNVPPRVRL